MGLKLQKRDWYIGHDHSCAALLDMLAMISCFRHELELRCFLPESSFNQIIPDRLDFAIVQLNNIQEFGTSFYFNGGGIDSDEHVNSFNGKCYLYQYETPEHCFKSSLDNSSSIIFPRDSYHIFSGWASRQIYLNQYGVNISNTRITGRPRYDLLTGGLDLLESILRTFDFENVINLQERNICLETGLFSQEETETLARVFEKHGYTLVLIDPLESICQDSKQFRDVVSNYIKIRNCCAVITFANKCLGFDAALAGKPCWFIDDDSDSAKAPSLGYINKPRDPDLFAQMVCQVIDSGRNVSSRFVNSLFHNFTKSENYSQEIIQFVYSQLFQMTIYGGILR